ncbi:uncharacterized protein LOC143027514 [Oratosquilla oratoria]|uniref:uncharacterized protein LOC143027514 n=1 Tax=Oratosquilla oratoria TaxID=337810 RepID=UPI003F76F148
MGGKLTVTNLLEALDIWTEALSHNLLVDVLFLDYAKAFDTVPHERLLSQIQYLGIRDNVLSWMRSFLTDNTEIFEVIQKLDMQSGDLQGYLNQLQDWASMMQMLFHPKKCKGVHLGNNNPTRRYTMTMPDGTQHTLEEIDEKDLGVIIDCKLSFSSHVYAQVNKVNKVLGAIRHTFASLDKETCLLYESGEAIPGICFSGVEPKTEER